MSEVIERLRSSRQESVNRLLDWLRIPSVSTDPALKSEVERAGRFIEEELAGAGFETEIHETAGHPIVTATWTQAPGQPTILIYGHYDVQPADPIELWHKSPFEPTLVDGNVVARGATDDKGQLYALVRGIGSLLKVEGRLPVNVKFLIEGEEEIGSPNLEPFIDEHRDFLKADVALISDCSQFGPDIPAITVGLKGLCYLELEITGPNRDLHSGSFGGTVRNPGNALCALLGQLVDERGRITIPGFYDDVIDLDEQERAATRELPFDDDEYQRELGVTALFGEVGYSTLERKGARPTLDINGLLCGYTGEGAKTVLPARASAKFSMRLVPDQEPDKIARATTDYLNSICPEGVELELRVHHGAEPVRVPTQSTYMKAAHRAVERGFGRAPVYMREGGSIPVVSTFKKKLELDTVLLGLGLPDDNAHSPNEKFNLTDFQRGMETVVHFLRELAAKD